MEDSDEEVFWGPVTARELKIIARQLCPSIESENSEIGTNTAPASELHPSSPNNMDNLNNNERVENDLSVQDTIGNDIHSVPEIVASSCSSNVKQEGNTDIEFVSDHGSFNNDMQEGSVNLIESNNSIFLSSLSDCCSDKTEFSDSTGLFSDTYNSSHSKFSSLSLLDPLEPQSSESANVNSITTSMHDVVTSDCDTTKPIHSVPEIVTFSCASNEKQECNTDIESVSGHGSFNNDIQEGSLNVIESNTSEFSESCNIKKNSRICNHALNEFISPVRDCCSDKTEFSDTTGLISDTYNSDNSKFSSLSLLDPLKLQSSEDANVNSVVGSMHDIVTSDCEANKPILSPFCDHYKACSSIFSNISSENDFQTIPDESDVRISNSVNNSRISIQNDYLHHSNLYVPKSASEDVSTTVHNKFINAENEVSPPSRNSKSKIPRLQELPCDSSQKNVNNTPSKKYCRIDCSQDNSNSHICAPLSPIGYEINSDNFNTMASNDSVSQSLLVGSHVHSSANYTQVKNGNYSECFENSFHKQKSQPSCNIERYTSSESDDSTYEKIEAVTDSVLCSILDSSSSDENSPNNTLEECEMMMKLGYEYMCSAKECALKQDTITENENNTHASFKIPKSKYEPVPKAGPKVLEPCQYIHSSFEGLNPQVFQKEFKEDIHGAAYKTPGKSLPPKPTSASYPRRAMRTVNFSDIKSPVAAYIKDHPVQLTKTAGRVQPCRKNIPSRNFGQHIAVLPKSVPSSSLPDVLYVKVPGFEVNRPKSVELHGSSKRTRATRTVIRHAGRAVLKAAPQNALPMKNVEMSVLYGKDVSQTMTLE